MVTKDDFIQSWAILEQFLAAQRELRREMLGFWTNIDEVWAKIPAALPVEERVGILQKLTYKYMEEIEYSESILTRRYEGFFEECPASDRINMFQYLDSLRYRIREQAQELESARLALVEVQTRMDERDRQHVELEATKVHDDLDNRSLPGMFTDSLINLFSSKK